MLTAADMNSRYFNNQIRENSGGSCDNAKKASDVGGEFNTIPSQSVHKYFEGMESSGGNCQHF
jgi:hypothetical protein